MTYLESFKFPDKYAEEDFRLSLLSTYHDIWYPFGVLSNHNIEFIKFDTITIFYGGNGSGKSTALNVISEKLKLSRDSLYNKSEFFENYLNLCSFSGKIPNKSKIIASDDVFDFMINLRFINEGVDNERESLLQEYTDLKYSEFRLKSIFDYDQLKRSIKAKKLTRSEFVRQTMSRNTGGLSNGESAYMYFTNKIDSNALYLLDEPENSLSLQKQLDLLNYLQDSARFYKCQFIIATHSPLLLSIKDALIYDFDENPVKTKKWTS